jgi:hypothetical protein
MKNGLVKLAVISLMFGSSLAHSSAIPAQKPGFTLNFTAFYLQPSADNLTYGIYTTPLPLPAPNWQQKMVNPGYTGAFDLGVQYNLPSENDNVKLDWFYFDSKDSASGGSSTNTSIGPVYYYGPTQQFILNTRADSTVKFNVDGGNLVAGHLFNLTNRIQFEPFAGLAVSYLKEDITSNFYGTDPVYGPYRHTVNGKSSFIGAGPRLGFDAKFLVTDHFSILTEIAGDILVGTLNYRTNFNSVTAYTADAIHNSKPVDTSMANQDLTRAIPMLGTKIGLQYQLPLNNSKSEFTFQAGYMYAAYFNAINQVRPGTLVPGAWEAGSVAIVTQVQQQSKLDLKGPYLSMSWKF